MQQRVQSPGKEPQARQPLWGVLDPHSELLFCWLQIGDRAGELTARMNVAQLQLVLGRLSPAAAEKPDLAGYEAQGESRRDGIIQCGGRSGGQARGSWDN